jgi:hypothetical protein
MYGYKNGNIPRGAILDGNNRVVADTFVCCHCGLHFTYKLDPKTKKRVNAGGHTHSKCVLCNWVTCGRIECDPHVPFEVKLEYTEAKEAGNAQKCLELLGKYPDIKRFPFAL